MLRQMAALSGILREKRHRRGSIDFDFPEAKLILDERGKPVDIRPYERNTATRLIEDFMLLANETVAETYFWREAPFIYRTHGAPDEEKLRSLAILYQQFRLYHAHQRQGAADGDPEAAGPHRGDDPGRPSSAGSPCAPCSGHAMRRRTRDISDWRQSTIPISPPPSGAIRSADPPHHQGRPAGRLNEKKAEHYRKILRGRRSSPARRSAARRRRSGRP